MTKTEIVRNLARCLDAPTDQDFEQKFEASGLEGEALDAATVDYKKSGHWVGDAKLFFGNQGSCGEGAEARNGGTEGIPTLDSVIAGVAAGDGDIGGFGGLQQFRQQGGGMLQVGIDHAEQVRT